MSNTLRKIEMTVFCAEQDDNYEVSYFDVKEVNDELAKAKTRVKKSIGGVRVIYRQKEIFEYKFTRDWDEYKDLRRKSNMLTSRFIKQCENRAKKYRG
jgi:hypothetical protein